jgi:hypothetical protein
MAGRQRDDLIGICTGDPLRITEVDVSKDCLDVVVLPEGWFFSVSKVSARARGVLAKNDRLDARLIAEYVAIMPTRVVQRDGAVERLAEVVTMRRQLCDEHVAVLSQS